MQVFLGVVLVFFQEAGVWVYVDIADNGFYFSTRELLCGGALWVYGQHCGCLGGIVPQQFQRNWVCSWGRDLQSAGIFSPMIASSYCWMLLFPPMLNEKQAMLIEDP